MYQGSVQDVGDVELMKMSKTLWPHETYMRLTEDGKQNILYQFVINAINKNKAGKGIREYWRS